MLSENRIRAESKMVQIYRKGGDHMTGDSRSTDSVPRSTHYMITAFLSLTTRNSL